MKRVISFLLVLVLCMSFAACAKQQGEDAKSKEPVDLTGKTIIWNGDSICIGKTVTGNWATRLAEKYQMEYKNYARGGGTIANGLPPTKSGDPRHSVVDTIDEMHKEYPNADFVVIEGGTNDADLLGNGNLGTFDPDNFKGKYKETTFCGALESVFYQAKKLWPGKKIVYIVAPKMGDSRDPFFAIRRVYFDKAIEICEKWDIPYIDLWNDSELDPSDFTMFNPTKTDEENIQENTGYYIDGQHLTGRGYDVTTELIEAWLKTV